MTVPPHYDLNEEFAKSAPEKNGTVYVFDSNKSKGLIKNHTPSIRKYLLDLLTEFPDTKGIRVGWIVSDVDNRIRQYLLDHISKHGLTVTANKAP